MPEQQVALALFATIASTQFIALQCILLINLQQLATVCCIFKIYSVSDENCIANAIYG